MLLSRTNLTTDFQYMVSDSIIDDGSLQDSYRLIRQQQHSIPSSYYLASPISTVTVSDASFDEDLDAVYKYGFRLGKKLKEFMTDEEIEEWLST